MSAQQRLFLTAALLVLALGIDGPATRGDDVVLASPTVVPASVGAAALAKLRTGDVPQALDELAAIADRTSLVDEQDDSGTAAAAGGLYRILSQRSTDEQYDLLAAWTLPDESRKSVRILTAFVPQQAPPKEFARLLGERPRETSFPIAQVGGVRGLFCSGWMLVQAARDVGRLRRLTSQLEELAAQQVPGAQALLLLARIADERSDPKALAEALQSRAIVAAPGQPQPLAGQLVPVIDPSSVALAAAALEREELRPLAEEILKGYVESTYGTAAPRIRQWLRVAQAAAVQRNRGESGPEVLWTNRLKYWVPVSGMTSNTHAAGLPEAMWLTHEDHILHLAGAGNDVLFFRYPLTGEFEFTCETQEGGAMGTDGGLVYGGLQFEALGSTSQLTVWDADLSFQATRPCPFVRHEEQPAFNRVSIRSGEGGVQFLANLHPMWFDTDAAGTSPWLGLRSFGPRRPVFRNLKLTGNPVIPREVHLTEGNELRGWRARFLGESQPPFAAAAPNSPNPSQAADFDWSIEDGVIHAPKRAPQAGVNPQSLLCYQRPLLEGESVSYEFHFEPDEFAVHPALGRLALIIEPDGVRIHWITDGQREWTGLAPDNRALEPLNRRGPATLPLKPGEWNAVSLARTNNSVTLTLNGELIYERPIDFDGDHTFGLYRDRLRSAVRVRNVVMTGDWPDAVPDEFLQNPATVVAMPAEPADRHVLNETIGSACIAENVRAVRRLAASLAPAERFEFLCHWVLPGAEHADFRIAGLFTQADPSPLAVSMTAGVPQEDSGQGPHRRGAELVSPVFDLLDVAAQLDRLDELQRRIAAIDPPDSEFQQRTQLALKALVGMELDEPAEQTGDVLGRLHSLVEMSTPGCLHDLWPETLVIYRAVHQHQAFETVGEMLIFLYEKRTRQLIPSGCEFWHTQIAAMMTRYRNLAMSKTGEVPDTSAPGLSWVSAARQRFASRGNGNAQALWSQTTDGELRHLSGHQEEYLLYPSPLRGEFELECDVASSTTQVLTAGLFCGVFQGVQKLTMGNFRKGAFLQPPIDPPLSKLDEWTRYRAVFRDGRCTIFLNGRQVYEIPLPEEYDPWIGIRSWWRSDARIRDVRITGNPIVPQQVVLSASPDLDGWLPYFNETAGYQGARWEFVADQQEGRQILGKPVPSLAGTWAESLLRYYRPLVEDGTIDYDFFYEPGRTIAHPALDRLAFLLNPNGVQVHWITDGPNDPTEVPPGNAVDEPDSRRGPLPLPLKNDDWNHLQLAIKGRTVRLTLNGDLIYQRELEPTNQRTFGLFHFLDTQLRVRNVVMRGDWPQEVPPVTGQPLADPLVAKFDAEASALEDVFTYDFARNGLDEEYFTVHNRTSPSSISPQSDGIHIETFSTGNWAQVAVVPKFTLHGDFDLEARFAGADFSECQEQGHIQLLARLADEHSHEARTIRGLHTDGREYIKGQLSVGYPDGTRRYIDTIVSHHSNSGRLRVARRGETVSFLFAEGDSEVFRLIGRETASDQETVDEGVRFLAVTNGKGRTSVVLKDMTLRAERMTLAPSPDQHPSRELWVMNADGTELRSVVKPLPQLTHLGSPEWSPDGRRIVLDMSTGSTTSSQIVVVPVDGSAPQNLGPGCMPSFSADAGRIVFSQPGQGIVTMNADGTNRQVLDPAGWGAQWSPDGQWIAYGLAGNVILMNPETRQSRPLLTGDAAQRYSSVYWNLGWSHDSRWIAFKGRNRQSEEYEVALADIAQADGFVVLYSSDKSINADFTFSPDNRQVLFAMHSDVHRGPGLFLVNREAAKAPLLLPGQPLDRQIFDCAWSPDGRFIAFSSQLPPTPQEWPPAAR